MIGMAKRSARLAVVAAVVAVAAGATVGQAAAAGIRPDDRSGIRGPGAVVQVAPRQAVRPDDRAGPRGVVAQSRVLRVVEPIARTSGSFHWDDALIGAGAAFGVAPLLALVVFGVRRQVRLAPNAPLPTSMERSL